MPARGLEEGELAPDPTGEELVMTRQSHFSGEGQLGACHPPLNERVGYFIPLYSKAIEQTASLALPIAL